MVSVPEQRAQLRRARTARGSANELRAYLESLPASESEVKIVVAASSGERSLTIPRAALERTAEVLEALGDGREPSVLPMAKELSTGEVASLLGVSRQYVVRLADEGRLAFRMVGNRRRIRIDEALRYLRDDDRERARRLRENAASTG